MFQALTNGMTTIINGGFNAVSAVADPFSIAAIASAVSLAWVARLEMAELDRQSAKPHVKRH